MALEKLDKAAWSGYFGAVSKGLSGRRVEIEVASLRIGDQILASWLPLFGIAYDPKDDVLEIALEGHDHLIHHPREMSVENPIGWSTLSVIDGDGVLQIVRLRELFLLPEHSEAG
jgi:hypothetical protein